MKEKSFFFNCINNILRKESRSKAIWCNSWQVKIISQTKDCNKIK